MNSIGRLIQGRFFPVNILQPVPQSTALLELIRCRHTKHWNPKFKKERRAKVIKIKLPDFHEKSPDDMTIEEQRAKMKERGLLPQNRWAERPIYISSTLEIFEPYVPPEGDGKYSVVTPAGAKQNIEFVSKKGKSYWAVKKIKSYEEEFNVREFPEIAKDIYIKAHEALARVDKDSLVKYVSERAYPEMMYNTKNRQIKWQFIKSLEPARVVHARETYVVSKTNIFAQVTVRFHTQQMLAIYDRFGRLMHGSEIVAKDVLEYVVFEKHLSNEYGSWRIHSKIIPPWLPSRVPSQLTHVLPAVEEETTTTETAVTPVTENVKSEVKSDATV